MYTQSCICVCVLCNFTMCATLWNHHNYDPKTYHCYKAPVLRLCHLTNPFVPSLDPESHWPILNACYFMNVTQVKSTVCISLRFTFSLRTIFLMLTQILLSVVYSFELMSSWYGWVWMYHGLLNDWPAEECLGSFQFGVTVKKAAMNICAQFYAWNKPLSHWYKYVGRFEISNFNSLMVIDLLMFLSSWVCLVH